jgi:L-threonylcarbamoyladenylate synthase
MVTKLITVAANRPEEDIIAEAAETLRRGEIVAFPTETVYGLGADVVNESAVRKVFEAKGRPPANPLIVHIDGLERVEQLATEFPPKAIKLAEAYWPGPLTLVLKKQKHVSSLVTAGLQTVALRVPAHAVPQRLVAVLGRGIVGPSANTSGKPSPTLAEHVYFDLNGKIEMILDAGPTRLGLESTVVDCTTDPPTILRPGSLTQDRIEEIIGNVLTTATKAQAARSPGMRFRHYAPNATVIILPLGESKNLPLLVDKLRTSGKNVGCILHRTPYTSNDKQVHVVSLRDDLDEIAKRLFHVMREMDHRKIDVIIVEAVEERGMGVAIMDRIRRAAAKDGE